MKLLGPPLISTITLLIFSFFIARYWKLLSQQTWRYRYMLFSLRIISLLFIILLLINPWFNWRKNVQKAQKISIIYDLSASMFHHFEEYPFKYDEIQKMIQTWGEKHDLNLTFFQLGRKITRIDKMQSVDLTTDFRDIPDFTSFEQPQQILLITDGKATVGKNINEMEFSKIYPIHIAGVGPIHTVPDIKIQDIILPDLLVPGDTVNLNIRIQSRIYEDIQSDLQIINEVGNQIYHNRMYFEKGNRLKDLTLKLPTDVLNGLNSAIIYPAGGETQIENNTFSFRGNLQDSVDNILLITGALSPNSRIIERVLSDIENANVHHFFRLDRMQWNAEPLITNYSNLKMVVLDDFPIHNQDSLLFQKIVSLSKGQQIPILYIGGPWGNLTAGEMINSTYPYFIPKAEDPAVLMDISTQSAWLETSGIDLRQFPPQRRAVKWIQSDKPWLAYMDESVLIGNNNNFYLVSLPALAESHFKISMNSKSAIYRLLHRVFLHAFHGSEGLLRLEGGGKYFNKGEIIRLALEPVKGIDLKDFFIQSVIGTDTTQLECYEVGLDKDIRCSTVLLKSGEYIFYAQASLPNGELVYSNTKSAIVQDVKIEMKELIQERQALMKIAHNTGGIYAPIDSLDTMLAHIDITPVQWLKYYQISGLSSQNYWWVLILLLSIEWYFRKKIGLL